MAKKNSQSDKAWYALAASRILLGIIFLWAFFDKLFGWGVSTPVERAWLGGGSPTTGFLKGVDGPFADAFNALAGQAWADWLFMFGLLGIGLGLFLGVAIRLSVVAGSLLLFLMWLASLPLSNNPFVDDHIVYIAVLVAIGYGLSEQKWSLAGWWQKQSGIKNSPWLW